MLRNKTEDNELVELARNVGAMNQQLIGIQSSKGATIVLLLYDAGKKATYTARVVLDSKTGKSVITPNDFSVKTDTGIDPLSAFTKGSTCRVYNNFFNGAALTDWPVQISKEFTF